MIKSDRMHCAEAREESGLVNRRITSSANRLILCSFDSIVKPIISFWDLILSARGSISVHPSLVPLVILNDLNSIEEQYTWAKG